MKGTEARRSDDRSVSPFNLRESKHRGTTEGVERRPCWPLCLLFALVFMERATDFKASGMIISTIYGTLARRYLRAAVGEGVSGGRCL